MANKPKEKPLEVVAEPGDTPESAVAKTVLRPTVQGALTARAYGKWFPEETDLNELVKALQDQTSAVNNGDFGRAEAMLTVQAHTLDAIFNNLARRACRVEYLNQFETHLKLGLRAQAQCRATWEAVSAIKNPPMANYVGQANIAQNQQINNASRAGETEKPPNELLEKTEHEPDKWLDRGATAEAARADSTLETVGEVDGAEDRRR